MDYLSGWYQSNRRLEGLTAIVTGSSSGIGKESARDFYLRGARVIMACIDITKAEQVKEEIEQMQATNKKGILVVEKLDLFSLKSVREFASKMLVFEPKINLLINNAGVMCCPEGRTEDGFETHMGINHFGHALLTLLLLPRMTASAPSRIVFVSSIMHMSIAGGELDFEDMNFEKNPYDPIKAYSRSKAANLIYARVLAQKLKERGITDVTTYSLHPGVINTEIARHFSDTLFNSATWIFRNIFSWFVKSPRCGAQTTIYCAIDDACADQSGLYYSDCAPTTPSKHTQDDIVGEKLWNLTLDLLKLKNYDPFAKVDPPKDFFVD